MAKTIIDTGPAPWMSAGACRNADPELFFPIGEGEAGTVQARKATSICRQCGVRAECLRYSLLHGIREGIWGGRTEQERTDMIRSRSGHRGAARERVRGGRWTT
jgi:WhiB family transcriptional regulator, redox-sensing transcriptional regulator